jgi:hypothetical protein
MHGAEPHSLLHSQSTELCGQTEVSHPRQAVILDFLNQVQSESNSNLIKSLFTSMSLYIIVSFCIVRNFSCTSPKTFHYIIPLWVMLLYTTTFLQISFKCNWLNNLQCGSESAFLTNNLILTLVLYFKLLIFQAWSVIISKCILVVENCSILRISR